MSEQAGRDAPIRYRADGPCPCEHSWWLHGPTGCTICPCRHILGDVRLMTTHADPDEYARIWNLGYEAAMAQQVAPDPTTADDWLAQRDRRVAAEALREAADLGPINFAMTHEEPKWRGYNHLVTTRWLRERADRIEAGE